MQRVEPIMVLDLFPQERKQLLELFSELEAEDWDRPRDLLEAVYERDEQKSGESDHRGRSKTRGKVIGNGLNYCVR